MCKQISTYMTDTNNYATKITYVDGLNQVQTILAKIIRIDDHFFHLETRNNMFCLNINRIIVFSQTKEIFTKN